MSFAIWAIQSKSSRVIGIYRPHIATKVGSEVESEGAVARCRGCWFAAEKHSIRISGSTESTRVSCADTVVLDDARRTERKEYDPAVVEAANMQRHARSDTEESPRGGSTPTADWSEWT